MQFNVKKFDIFWCGTNVNLKESSVATRHWKRQRCQWETKVSSGGNFQIFETCVMCVSNEYKKVGGLSVLFNVDLVYEIYVEETFRKPFILT